MVMGRLGELQKDLQNNLEGNNEIIPIGIHWMIDTC